MNQSPSFNNFNQQLNTGLLVSARPFPNQQGPILSWYGLFGTNMASCFNFRTSIINLCPLPFQRAMPFRGLAS